MRNHVTTSAPFRNALLTDPGLSSPATAYVRPQPIDAPLLRAVGIIGGDGDLGAVRPVTAAMTNAAAAVDEGDLFAESAVTYTVGEPVQVPGFGHRIPLTRQALRHSEHMRADVDQLLVSGLLGKLETYVGARLAAASGTVAHAFDTDLATTIRTGIAAAQSAFVELGAGEITVALSPLDHAALDLSGHDLAEWPATIISTPSLPAGTAYISRMGLAVQAHVSAVLVDVGTVMDQFNRNEETIRAYAECYAHVAAPGALVEATLTAP
jgi:hypothetical protein